MTSEHEMKVQGYIPASAMCTFEDGKLEVPAPSKNHSAIVTYFECSCGKEFEVEENAENHMKKVNNE